MAHASTKSYSVCYSPYKHITFKFTMIAAGIDECGITTHPKKNHQYLKINNIRLASYDNRLKTFKKWPKSYSEYQVTSLCDAGFFYTGISDKLECFCCGARLCNW
ncbi:MAG TPA: hypothetical protein DDZ41_11515, partial [Flavobacterium sp.]|nr:hypothetical protein [Flavobacterium sp.]